MLSKSVVAALMALIFACAHGSFAMENPLTASVIDSSQKAGTRIYTELLERQKNDPARTFVEQMVSWEKIHEELWTALTSQAFSEGRITPADLDYVVRQYSYASKPLDAEKSRELFKVIITNRLEAGGDKAKAITQLLQSPVLEVSFGSKLVPSSLGEEKRSVLVSCLEQGHMDAFKTILNSWPKYNESVLFEKNIIVVAKKVEQPGFFVNSYIDQDEKYTLAQWLFKNLENPKGIFNSWNGPDYKEAANQLLFYVISRAPNKNRINGDILNIAAFLKRNNQLASDFIFTTLVEEVVDIQGLKWEDIPDYQQAEILKSIPQEFTKTLKDKK